MTKNIGTAENFSDIATVTTVSVGSAAPVVVSVANPDRSYLRIDLAPGSTDRAVFVRDYPASTDNLKQGKVLVRLLSGNDNVSNLSIQETVDGMYRGEISAITEVGSVDLFVTEW